MTMNYSEFIHNKIELAQETGLNISMDEISTVLKPHQRDIVYWGIRGGCRAFFESFGLGKTLQQLEVSRIILNHVKGKALIVCPLGVRQEFKRDAKKLLNIDIHYVRNQSEVDSYNDGEILITNYERVRDGDINPHSFIVTHLDEASVLRGYGTKTFQTFLQLFKGVRFKFVSTATPSPNRYKELIHYAGYLEIMDTGQALTRFFQRDSTKANKLTLYPHKEKEFFLWLSSWAIFITKPSDLGYSDEGYDLPEMKILYHEVKVDHSTAGTNPDGQSKMFRDSALGLKDAAKEKRDSMQSRVDKMNKILSKDPEENYIIWHDLEAERHAVKKTLPDAVDVYGSQNLDIREQRIIDFSDGKIKYLVTKPVISGQGCNFQYHCHKAIFLGIGYKFNDFIQAIHRIYRFQQIKQVEIHIIYAESEVEILRTLQNKWEQHKKLVKEMTRIIKENGLNLTNTAAKLARSIGVERKEVKGELFTAVNNDCVMETMAMDENSMDMIITSIPFSNHYEYTPQYEDFGHTKNDEHFFEQMDFLTPNLLKVLKPGRVAAIHVKDRINFGNVTGMGMPTVNPFHAQTIFHYIKHGFAYFGMITIETDVVRENNQTYRLGWTEQCKDGSKMGVGSPEYILLFRKLPTDLSRAYADEPVRKSKNEYERGRWQIDARAKWNSSGDRFLSPEEISQLDIDQINKYYSSFMQGSVYDYDQHIRVAVTLEKVNKLPSTFETLKVPARYDYVWSDVNRMRTLNSEQTRKKLQNHICPLQFDIVDRLIYRFSNEGETVFDPFGGIYTTPSRAIKLKRKGYACELNPYYHRDGVKYCVAAENEILSPSLFDVFEIDKKEIA